MTLRMMKIILIQTLILLVLPLAALAVDCFQCHDAADFKGRVVHAPVVNADCLSCHGPHVSRHEKLLLRAEQDLCFECHEAVAEAVRSRPALHAPVRDGLCSSCHSPHASAQRKLLKRAGGALCFECHETSKQDYQVSHPPFADGRCSSCHAAHGGDDNRLLKSVGSDLCFNCHKGSQALRTKHLGKDMKKMDCLACHHPHGGESKSLLRSVSHVPFAKKNCRACHGGDLGVDSCLKCHEGVLSSFNYAHNHLGIAGQGNPCVACHNPHVGDRQGLLPENVGNVCRECHADTFARQEKNLHKHSGWNQCADCHNLHGTNGLAMLKQGQDVCNLCHDQHKGFTHPIGAETLDPRNNQPMDCLTCHNGNDGSNYRYFLRGSGERGLCVQCHQSY